MVSSDNEDQRIRARAADRDADSILLARQRVEHEVHRQSEWLRITLGSIGDAVISTDSESRISFMNVVAEVLTGWSLAEALGRPLPDVFQIVNEQTRQPVANPALMALQKGTIVGLANHTILIARDGTERPIDDSAAPIRNDSGLLVGAVLVFRDVTERKQAEMTREHLASIVEFSDDAIISKTLKGIILSWNAGAERLFEYTRDETIGRSINLIIPPERQHEELEILARIASGDRIAHFETVRFSKSGRRIDISLTVSPIRDTTGQVIGASKVARDISDRKRIEESLRVADKRKDDFIALLAHELRNPLAPLRNGLEVMRLGANNADAVASARDMMERQMGHMVRIIDDLLDISRISQNKMELRRSTVLLADIIRSAVETVRPAIDVAGHELIIDLPSEPVYLEADLTRMAQVFGNLLSNSVKYTKPGGHIGLSVERRSTEVAISVRDTGSGIPANCLESIFDMFSQVDRIIERTAGGLGIGLALVKGLVQMHGGTVKVTSAGEDQGSTFTVVLPVLNNTTTPVATAPLELAGSTAGSYRRILIADDNRDSADSMAILLRLKGNDVRTAFDGVEAVTVAEVFRPDAILMDLGMPKLNGYEATKQIRVHPWGRSIRIIAMTGWGQPQDRVRSQEAGCDGHLVKPIEVSDFEKMLTDLDIP